MAVLDVVKYGDPVLRKVARKVEDFGAISNLINDMFDTMYEEEGIGLAANQIGVDLDIMVVDVSHTDESDQSDIFINGEMIKDWGTSTMEEGCLSLPEIRVDVKRPEFILFKYQDLNGVEHEKEYGGLYARVIQHETDHLKGKFIIDRINSVTMALYKNKLIEIAANPQIKHTIIDSPGITL